VHALPTHVWFTHAVAVPQVPDVVHACSCVRPLHWVCPCAHTPVHAVPTQVVFTQLAAVFHVPVDALHVCSCVSPLHCVWPGAQFPVHAPSRHVWLEHADAPPKVPSAWHVSTLLPEHVF
jgi:hypothetical protein